MATKKKTAPQRKKRGSYHHGNLREALLEAAVKRIAASQEFDFRLRDLAEDCGVRLAACYRHFPAKRDVLVELARRGFVGLKQALSAAGDETHTAADELRALGLAYLNFARAHSVSYLAMFHPSLTQRAPYPELASSAQLSLQPLQAAVARLLGPKASDPQLLESRVFQAWAGVHGYASLRIAHELPQGSGSLGQAESQAAIQHYVESLVCGVGA